MKLDMWVLLFMWLSSIFVLWRFVPKKKARDAHIIFLFYQGLMWAYGLTIVQFQLAEFPVREFEHATGINFTMYYVFYPTYAVLMHMFYPETRGEVMQAAYMVGGTLLLTVMVQLLGFTHIYKVIDWNMYLTFASHLIMLYITRRFYLWFRKGLA